MADRNTSLIACTVCQSIYLRSIRVSARPETGQFSCSACGKIIAQWHTSCVPIYKMSDQVILSRPVEPPRNTKLAFAEAIANENRTSDSVSAPRTISGMPIFLTT